MADTKTHTAPLVTLRDGRSIPQLGIGVWQIPDEEVDAVVEHALERGYRHVDTARVYRNERGVGRALRRSSVPREEVFVTTKLWNSDQGFDEAIAGCTRSLERLGLDWVDLYLVHWPAPAFDRYLDSWRALVELQREGRTRSIGVSNFLPEHLERIIEATGAVPAINQVEVHPYFQQRELRALHERLGIATVGYSPLGQGGELLEDPVLVAIANRHGCTPAQVAIAWQLAEGCIVIPKSATPARIAENLAALEVQLTERDLAEIATLDRPDGRIGGDPAFANYG